MAAVGRKARVGPGGPVGVAGEDLVVVLSAEEAHDAQLDHQRIDDLLGFNLGERAVVQIALKVHVQERGEASDRHCGTVLALDGREVAEVGPLHRFFRVRRRPRNVEAVVGGHLLQLLQRLDLLGVLFAVAGPVLREPLLQRRVLGMLLFLDEEVHTVQGDPAVVADDAAAAIGVWQTRHDVRRAGSTDARGVDVKDGVVVRLPVFGENLLHLRVHLFAGFLDGLLNHAPAAVRHHGAFGRGVRLQTHDDVVVLGDVPRLERVDVGGGFGVDVVDATVALDGEVVLIQVVPEAKRFVGCALEERCIPVVRGVVALDEIADVDAFHPRSRREAVPCAVFKLRLCRNSHSCTVLLQ